MEENKNPNAGQGLGIAGLILGIIALIISFIPCLGMWAIVPGIIAIVLSAVGFSQANKANAAKGLVIAALIISIVGTAIAGWQFYIFRNAPSKFEQVGKKIQKAMEEEFDEEDMKELEDAMEELEGEIEEASEENAEEIERAAGKALKEFSKEVEKTKKELKEDSIEE
ncbi:MAG: hypothetical protein R6V23_10715 [Bacteroidales bacterium]